MSAVAVHNLVKKYKSGKEITTAVQGVSFEVAKGELFGIIGPDGAGKTSVFRMLTTLVVARWRQGNGRWFGCGKRLQSIRRKVGYMPGRFSLYQDLTVEENLHFFATIFNTSVAENYNLIKDIYVQIAPFKNRMAANCRVV